MNLKEFNPQQLKAITSNDRTILCLAGAGAGKTKTLLGRVQRLVEDGVDPKSILCLTFTNAAAFEMKERFKKLPGVDVSRGVPEFRTFHGFCYSIIVKDKTIRERLGYTKIPQICDDAHLKQIKELVRLQIGTRLTLNQLDSNMPLSRAEEDERILFKKGLIKAIKKENVITFDIMCYNVCELFEKNEDCVLYYKNKYRYLFVDEFQDTDRKQMRFISSFPETTSFWLCADALQNIYAFRGTTNEYVKQLSTAPDWTVIKLYKNYRSTTNICNFANKFSKYAKDEYRIEMEGQREGEDPEIVYGSCCSYEYPVDPDHLSILLDKLRENKNESAILCRSNKEVAAVKKALTDAGIEFTARSKETDNVNYLESALSNDYMLEWLSSKLEAKDYSDYIRLSTQVPNPDIRWFLDLYGRLDIIRKPAEKVVEIRNITMTKDTPQVKFEKIAKLLRSKTKCTFTGTDASTNKEVVEMLRDQIQELEECPVYAGTIHSVKGLEYDTVYVMGANDRMFRLDSEEMNNLFYVAITRAKNHLVVFRR